MHACMLKFKFAAIKCKTIFFTFYSVFKINLFYFFVGDYHEICLLVGVNWTNGRSVILNCISNESNSYMLTRQTFLHKTETNLKCLQ